MSTTSVPFSLPHAQAGAGRITAPPPQPEHPLLQPRLERRPALQDPPDAPAGARQPRPLGQLDRLPHAAASPRPTCSAPGRSWPLPSRPLREVEPNLFVLNPLAVPLYGKPGRWPLTSVSSASRSGAPCAGWASERPDQLGLQPGRRVIAGTLGEETLIYYCVDEYTAFSGVASQPWPTSKSNSCASADLVIVSADLLYASKCEASTRTRSWSATASTSTTSAKALDPATLVPESRRPAQAGHRFLRPDRRLGRCRAAWREVARHFSDGSLVVAGQGRPPTCRP